MKQATQTVQGPGNLERRATSRPVRRWGWSHVFALIGVPILFAELWTLVAWLSDGPHQITQYREAGRPFEWWTARGAEISVILLSLWVIVRLVKGCRQERKLFTFDVMLCIAGASQYWVASLLNYFQPLLAYNSYFVNVNDPCGYIPGVVNPVCSATPSPAIFMFAVVSFVAVGMAWFLCWVLGKAKARWPSMTRGQEWAVLMGASAILVFVTEMQTLPLHLWSYPGTPWSIPVFGGARYPIVNELTAFTMWTGLFSALMYFKNDRGQTIAERNLEGYSPRVARGITFMAIYGAVQLLVIIPGTAPDLILGFHQKQWPADTPPALVNGMCDVPGGPIQGTEYGPCPGSPGFKMPLK